MWIEKFDLQFFAEEKTEDATPKKKREARQKGQVAQSKDLPQAIALIVIVLTIQLTTSWFSLHMFDIMLMVTEKIPEAHQMYDMNNLTQMFGFLILKTIYIIGPILMAALLTGVIGSYVQIGFLFSVEAIKPKLNKISPISGFKRLFSLKSVVEMVKAIAKGLVLVYIVYSYLENQTEVIIGSYLLSLENIIALMWDFVVNIVIRCAAFLMFVAVLDLTYKRWQHNKDLRMSKKEIKDEYKQTEGDPMLKGKIREKQRQMAMSRMMQDVPDADVVITNPTHYAVAIVYNSSLGASPKILAKGQNLVAQNIKRIASENDVMVVENKPLARALFASVEVGDFIPADLYQAVAEVLAYVYSLKDKKVT